MNEGYGHQVYLSGTIELALGTPPSVQMQMGEVQSKTGQDDLSENNGLGKMGKLNTQAEKHKKAIYGRLFFHRFSLNSRQSKLKKFSKAI